jgi:Domain of unknown function (DUF4476)
MKKQLLLLFSLCLVSIAMQAQYNVNLVIFSEDGDQFYAYINGVKQNSKPEANVKVTGISPNISLRIEFENKTLPQLKQSMMLDEGFEHTAKIKRNLKKELKLRYFGRVPIAEAAGGMPSVAYHTAEDPNPAYNTASDNTVNTPNNANVNTSVTSSTVTTTHNNTTKPGNGSVSMNVGGVGINMNVSGMDESMNSDVNTTTSTTVTSSHSSSGTYNSNVDQTIHNPKSQPVSTPVVKGGCSMAMSDASFGKMKSAVAAKPFSDTKMSTAKIATKSNCLSVNQVKEICKLFSMDDDKLAYAKYAYNYCIEKGNYYQVSEVFSFSSTTDDFNKFLEQ